MLFDVTRGELADLFGEDRLATLPATAFPPAAADTPGARLLRTVGVPTGTFHLREPDEESGRLPLVRDVVDVEDFEGCDGFEGCGGAAGDAAGGPGAWPVIGWLLNAHIALAPGSGAVYAVDLEEEAVLGLHTDVSSLIHVTLRFQRLLEEFTFGDDDEEAGFERLDREVDRIRAEIGGVDPLPFRDDETTWSVIGDEIAAGRRFRAGSPAARRLYG
ncbi:SUKH-4 family immunity protein [Streptomyces pactum]|uniref:SUKH-4 family immunity protein n=1 Tax=Streptomyces pactum TaxID=68249 RepID=UPI0036FF746D